MDLFEELTPVVVHTHTRLLVVERARAADSLGVGDEGEGAGLDDRLHVGVVRAQDGLLGISPSSGIVVDGADDTAQARALELMRHVGDETPLGVIFLVVADVAGLRGEGAVGVLRLGALLRAGGGELLDDLADAVALLVVGIRRRLDGLQTTTRSGDAIDYLRQKATRTTVDLFGALLFGACCREAGDDALLYLTRKGGEGLD